MSEPNRTTDEAPERMIDDLSAIYGAGVSTPASVDSEIQAIVRQRFAYVRRRRMVLRLTGVSAAAAAVALVVLLGRPAGTPETAPLADSSPVQTTAPREDVDGNGRVDILDAFALARWMEETAEMPQKWDIDGDGSVDGADVGLIAAAAVRLERG